MMTVFQQVSFKKKKHTKKHQQAFLSLIVLNLFHQCMLPGNNAKSSYDHLIKHYTKDISSLVLLVSQQKSKFCFKNEDAQKKPDYLLFSLV